MGYRHLQNQAATIQAYSAASDTLTVKVDRDGAETASRETIILPDEKDLQQMDSRSNPQLAELQRLVKELRGQVQHASIMAAITELERTVETRVSRDTVDAIVIYEGSYKDEWVEWNGRADADSFMVNLKVVNKYEYSQTQRNPIFKKPVVTTQVKNLNPYTRTKELVSFDVDVPVDRFTIGPSLTYGIDPLTQTTHTVVGIGAQIKLIGIK